MRIVQIRAEPQGTGRRKVGALGFTAPPILHAPAIASGEAWFSPVINGGLQISAVLPIHRRFADYLADEAHGRRKTPNITATFAPPRIFAPAIPSGITWFTPFVGGPISVSPIASGESWPTPLINLQQRIIPGSAIPTGESWFLPYVANVQTVSPPKIASGESWFSPVVTGGPKYISIQTIRSGESWPSPSVTGGAQDIFLFLSGTDRTQYLSKVDNTFQIQSQTLGRWQATFDLYVDDGSFTPALGQTVLVQDYGARLFAGCIQTVQTDRFLSTVNKVIYHLTATDKSGICDHRVITGKTYAAADWSDVSGVILDIVSTFLNGEGITTQGVPPSMGALPSDLNFNFPTVTQAFDQIANLTGTVWWVDADGILHFSSLSDLPAAPFSLSESSGNWRGSGGSGGGLTTTQTTQAYYNKLYAVSNLNIVPGANNQSGPQTAGTTETFHMTKGSAGVTIQVDPNNIPVGILASVALGSVLSMTVNGHAQTVYDFVNDYKAQARANLNDYLWVFAAGNNQLSWTYEPPLNATVVITYVPYVATSSSIAQYGTALSPLDPFGAPLGTCGSGVYEGVIQVQNISDQGDLNAIAAADLARIGGVPTIVNFQTDLPGLRPGQLLSVDVPLSGCSAKHLLITKMTGTYMLADLGHSGQFRWDVEATTNLDPGNWIAWFERLVARTNNPLPVLQYEIAEFVLAPGGSLSSGTSTTNPYFAKRTGLAVEVLVGAGTPPLDQDLILTITRNGVSIVQVKLPSTAISNAAMAYEIPQTNQLYVYKQDSLNVDVSYQVTGANPVPAANVSLSLRWGM